MIKSCSKCDEPTSNASPVAWAALVLALLALLSVGSAAALAATGKPLIIGAKNKADRTTSLASSSGPALTLRAPAGVPPMSVNSDSKVGRLNADELDGLDSSAFALKGQVPSSPNLRGWVVMVAGRACPTGSTSVGLGGGYGAEDQAGAGFGTYLYSITTSGFTGEPTLVRDRAPLIMTACKVN